MPVAKKGGIVRRAVDRLGKAGREFPAHGRYVDADLLEHLALHDAAHSAAAFARSLPLRLAIPRGIDERCVAARLALDRLELHADAVAQRFEPASRRLLPGVEREGDGGNGTGHAGKPSV